LLNFILVFFCEWCMRYFMCDCVLSLAWTFCNLYPFLVVTALHLLSISVLQIVS
jgi:hypothetical protein